MSRSSERTIGQNLSAALNFLDGKFDKYQLKGDIVKDIIYTGTEQPEEDHIALWVDTTDNNNFCAKHLDAYEIAKNIASMNQRVRALEYAFENEISFGDFTNNVTTELEKMETSEDDEPGVVISRDTSEAVLANGNYEVTETKIKTKDFTVESAEIKYKQITSTITVSVYESLTDDTLLSRKTSTNDQVVYTSLNHDTNAYDENSQVVYTITLTEQTSEKLTEDKTIKNIGGEDIAVLKAGSINTYIKVKTTSLDQDDKGNDVESSTQSWSVYNTYETSSSSGNEYTYKTINTNFKVANNDVSNTTGLTYLSASTDHIDGTRVSVIGVDGSSTETETVINKKANNTTFKTETITVVTYEDDDNPYLKTSRTTTTKWELDADTNEYVVLSGPTTVEVVEDTKAIQSYTPNAKHLRIKSGKYSELKAIIDSKKIPFLSGELLYCYDTNQLFIVTPYNKIVQISSSGDGDSSSSGGSGSTIQVDLTKVTDIGFISKSWATQKDISYTMKVNGNGELVCRPSTEFLSASEPTTSKFSKADVGGALVNAQADLYLQKLYINSFYCGGLTSDKYSYNVCDYNFVELSNLTNKDINLTGLSLQYSNGGQIWDVLPLEGIIKAQSTFLIRGAKCSVSDINTTIINVPEPDMHWYKTTITTTVDDKGVVSSSSSRDLIKFSNIACKFVLMYGTNACPVTNPFWVSGTNYAVEYGYIDMVGTHRKGASGAANLIDGYETKVLAELSPTRLFVKYYTMDPVSQATKALTARDNSKDWQYIELGTANKETGLNKVNVNTLNYIPKPKKANKDIFYNKTHLVPGKANMVTCSFGINATDPCSYEFDSEQRLSKVLNFDGSIKYVVAYEAVYPKDGEGNPDTSAEPIGTVQKFYNDHGVEVEENNRDYGATRCFNWVSLGYYDEFIFYRKKGETAWKKAESFKKNSDGTFSSRLVRYNYDIYNRQRIVSTSSEAFTSHKYVMPFLMVNVGETIVYEYYCGTANYTPTQDDIYQFTIRNSHDVDSFGYIQVSDQQGFNSDEYRVWGYLADYIEKKESHGSSYKVAGDYTYGESTVDGQSVINDVYTALGSNSETPDCDGFDFVVNTGDMTQNGNRLNEWIDYYNNSKVLCKKYEQMYIIGNNDLCPASYQGPESLGDGKDTSKINGINFQFFFTYEFDPNNIPFVTTESGEQIYIHSLYSFNYGTTHFLAANSEITSNTNATFYKGTNAYKFEKDWCEYDAEHLPSHITWRVAYCHEMPYTILTKDVIASFNALSAEAKPNYDRGGSHFNTVYGAIDATQKVWFSRFLENYGFQLCMCGHKHTYSLSRNLRENYKFRWDGETTSGNELVHGQEYDSKDVYLRDLVESGVITEPDTKKAILTKVSTFIPIIQKKEGLDENITSNNADMWVGETRTKYNAPIYSMLQSSGYKHTSNKELPGQNNPWLRSYFPITDAAAAQAAQKYPFYTKWVIASDYLRGNPYRGEYIMSSGKFNVNTYKSTVPVCRIRGNGLSSELPIIISKDNTKLSWVNEEE